METETAPAFFLALRHGDTVTVRKMLPTAGLADTVVQLTFVFLRVIFRGSPAFRSSHILTKDADSADSARPLHYSKSDSRLARAPALSPCYSLTHAHRSIGYRNRNPQLLGESTVRLMYLRVYDIRDSSRQPTPYVYMTAEIVLASLHLPRPYATRTHMHTGPLVIAIAG
jgi:hypothetical protein